MIGSINGPDAPDAVAWLEARLERYWHVRARVDRLRVQARTEIDAWERDGAALSGRSRPPGTISRMTREDLRVLQTPGIGAMHRPMFEILDDLGGDAEAMWPRPCVGDDIGADELMVAT